MLLIPAMILNYLIKFSMFNDKVYECVHSLVVISMENGINMPSSNSSQACFIHFYTNSLGKGISPFCFPLSNGLNNRLDWVL